MELIKIEKVDFSYTMEAPALRDVSLSMERGDLIGIIGPNGAGKTTLIKLINGLIRPDSGSIEISEKDIRSYQRKELARKMAVVYQNPALFFSFTVEETVAMGRWAHLTGMGWMGKRDWVVVDEAMERTEIDDLRDRYLDDLSGGEKQRVFISRALAQEAEILILDEPVAHLDVRHQLGILELLEEINRGGGQSIILVLHDLNLAARFCRKVVVLKRGEVVAVGTPVEIIVPDLMMEVFGVRAVIDKNPLSGSPRVTMGLPSREGSTG